MKLRSPSSCGAVTYAGCAIEIDANGDVDVEDDVGAALLAHGFIPSSEVETEDEAAQPSLNAAAQDDIALLGRRDLFALLKSNGVSVSLPVTNDELRRMARGVSRGPITDDARKGS